MSDAYLEHFGVKGMRWGVRKDDGSGLSRKDQRWVKKNTGRVTAKAQRKSASEIKKSIKPIVNNRSNYTKEGRLNATALNQVNRQMASIMTKKVADLKSPSGKTIAFIAKRGEVGVYMALADSNYDLNQVKNGVFGSGKIAYKKTVLDKA